MTPPTLDEARFETLAVQALERLFEAVETQLGDFCEADLEGAILTLELEDERQFVLNKHAPNRQLWLSSPVSGAHHFAFDEDEGTWVSTRGAGPLDGLLAEELSQLSGQKISF